MISFTNPAIKNLSPITPSYVLQSSIKLSLDDQVVGLVDDYLLLFLVLMQVAIILLHSARQFLQ